MKTAIRSALMVGIACALAAGGAGAASTDREPPPARPAAAAPSAEQEYGRGLVARSAKDWPAAAGAFRRAVNLRPAYPEAWNELGYALRNQGRYADSLAAYDEALRLRPNFPEALEYLGEAYVKLGRVDDARKILERLKTLDAGRAGELAEAIDKGK
jgi:tetratricopeptide (TPR) repeat protein